MDLNLLEALLYQNESETLDFKIAQYPFEKATDGQKGELLKDILAFVNAWRQSDAYILIGVEEVRGGKSVVHGITDQLLNRNLQQFVHSKTNRPVSFSYSKEILDGKEIGVISIPLQDRPAFLKKDYGNLRAHVVYTRRGDTTGEADPDEVFRMGLSAGPSTGQPVLELDFFDQSARRKLGHKIELESISIDLTALRQLPPYGPRYDPTANKEYYRELAQWVRDTTFLCPVGIAVTNTSTTSAENVIVTIDCTSLEITILDEASLPRKPGKVNIRSAFDLQRGPEQSICVAEFSGLYEIQAKIGTVQPGMTGWSSDVFYVGARQATSIEPLATISANNLRVPKTVLLKIGITASSRSVEASDILALED